MAKVGTVFDIKGFIMNKLFEDERIGGRHVSYDDLKTGYPPEHLENWDEAIDQLKKEGRIVVHPGRTRRGSGLQVAAIEKALKGSRAIMNAYRRRTGLLPWNTNLTGTLSPRETRNRS